MAFPQFTVAEALARQARACERAGSSLYGQLLDRLTADHAAGGPTADLLDGVSDQPVHDAVPLRYLATAHRLALAGDAAGLAAFYPSCGGAWNADGSAGGDVATAFLAVVDDHRDEFEAGLRRNVQTNEVGRAAVLASGFSHVVERHGLPLRTLELGASAGLLSRWPWYCYDTGESKSGDPHSELRFDQSWFRAPFPALHPSISVVETAASDISPIDASTSDGRLTMLSFLWPDQTERRDRIDIALDIARRHPVPVERCDAGVWLSERLGDGLPTDVATVVFHSIVWQYLPRPTREAVKAALADAGARTTTNSPLHWLRMEPAAADHADLRLTTWPGGDEHVLARVGYHGADIGWMA